MKQENNKPSFASDYLEGAHPAILQRLAETNMIQSAGYGMDEYSESARQKIRAACEAPEADVFFLVGGTQANATIIDAILRNYQGVIAAETGHISIHEAGAIEHSGHKVLSLPQENGKLSAREIASTLDRFYRDETHEHMVQPGMVYLSQPTEYGTLYSYRELKEISEICHQNGIALYVDGARLAYALACPENDVSLPALAELCDVFYIGGTKCGALFGEAVVIPKHGFLPHLFTTIKQHGALLAKGRIAGIQFDTLFTDHLYEQLGQTAMEAAARIRKALLEKGYQLAFPSPTNQIFVTLEKTRAEALGKTVELGFWENLDENHMIVRIATSWATRPEAVAQLIEAL
ncbi:MAG: aminotransferase class V-fold PLP-dependent enzyme [Oscillospiraceae bacterium]|nr:aminotransferase class V-fold PLP-dependent enzyme [Oscillospiraceae bacterium]